MEQYIQGSILVVVGLSLLYYRSRFAESTIKFQNKFWGHRFGQKEIDITKMWIPVFSAIAVVYGVAILFGFAK